MNAVGARGDRAFLRGTWRVDDATYARRLLILVFLLIASSVVASLPQMLQLLNTGKVATGANVRSLSYLAFRLPRELLLLGLLAYLGFGYAVTRRRFFLHRRIVVGAALALGWVLACLTYVVFVKQLPVGVPVLGLKIFQYTPALLAGYLVARHLGAEGLLRFADLLRWYTAPLAALGLFQVATAPGSRTLFGARSFAVFSNYNAFGSTLVACGLWFLMARIQHIKLHGSPRYGGWIALCCVMAVTTGSRTAITLSFVLVALGLQTQFSKRKKLITVVAAFAIIGTFPFLFSSQEVTGRKVERSNSTRVSLAQDVVDTFQSPADLVFGSGLGLFSKATVVIYGEGRFDSQVGNPHSLYLEIVGGFGVVGLFAYLCVLLVPALPRGRPELKCFLLIVGLLGLPMNLSGLFPVDALLLFLWGQLLGLATAGGGVGSRPVAARGPSVATTGGLG